MYEEAYWLWHISYGILGAAGQRLPAAHVRGGARHRPQHVCDLAATFRGHVPFNIILFFISSFFLLLLSFLLLLLLLLFFFMTTLFIIILCYCYPFYYYSFTIIPCYYYYLLLFRARVII